MLDDMLSWILFWIKLQEIFLVWLKKLDEEEL